MAGIYEGMQFPDYIFREYPKHVHGEDGEFLGVANSKAEEDALHPAPAPAPAPAPTLKK